MRFSGDVNPIDWKRRSGMRQKDFPLSFPAILGRDVSGVVRAVGPNVKHFKAGDQLVRLATNVEKGQVVLITGALGERLCTRRRR